MIAGPLFGLSSLSVSKKKIIFINSFSICLKMQSEGIMMRKEIEKLLLPLTFICKFVLMHHCFSKIFYKLQFVGSKMSAAT